MSLRKSDIRKNIKTKAQLSSIEADLFLNRFLDLIKISSKSHNLKLSRFGTFYFHKSPKRVGRNPRTMEEHEINSIEKLSFKTSKIIKSFLN